MYEILFQYSSFTLTTFDFLLAVAFVVATVFLIRFIHFKKMKLRFLVNHFHYFILIPLLGGRLVYIVEHFSVYRETPLNALYLWDMGFSSFGTFYSLLILLYILCHRDHEDFWPWMDAFSLAGLVALFFIHLGHFFNGTNYGKPTDLPWGIAFDTFNIPFISPIHPTQLYSALATFLIFGYAMRMVKRTHLAGVAGTFSVMLYSLAAFGIDFIHGAPSMYSKITFLAIASVAFIFFIHCTHKKLFEFK